MLFQTISPLNTPLFRNKSLGRRPGKIGVLNELKRSKMATFGLVCNRVQLYFCQTGGIKKRAARKASG